MNLFRRNDDFMKRYVIAHAALIVTAALLTAITVGQDLPAERRNAG